MQGKAKMLAIVLVAAWGCGESMERPEPVPLENLPAGSIEAATKALPDVKFDRARKVKLNGQDAYEVIGKDKRGKSREVEVSATGQVLNIE